MQRENQWQSLVYKVLLQFTKWYLQVELDEAILLDCLCNIASMFADFDALRKNHRKKARNALMSIQAVVIFFSLSLWLCEFVVHGVSFACVDIRRFKWKLITLQSCCSC